MQQQSVQEREQVEILVDTWYEVQSVEPEFFYHSQYAWDFYYQLRLKNGRIIAFRNLRLFRRIDRKLKCRQT